MPGLFAERLRDLGDELRGSAVDFCEDKTPAGIAGRAVLLAFLVYTGVRCVTDDLYSGIFGGLTLVVHEAGHLVCQGLGHTMYILGGSLMQLAVPAFCAAYLLIRQRDWFGFVFGLSWLAFSEWNLATYIADANKENLPLASLSPGVPHHDWATLLTEWHDLNSCEVIARWVRVSAFGTWSFAMVLGLWLLTRMVRGRRLRA